MSNAPTSKNHRFFVDLEVFGLQVFENRVSGRIERDSRPFWMYLRRGSPGRTSSSGNVRLSLQNRTEKCLRNTKVERRTGRTDAQLKRYRPSYFGFFFERTVLETRSNTVSFFREKFWEHEACGSKRIFREQNRLMVAYETDSEHVRETSRILKH